MAVMKISVDDTQTDSWIIRNLKYVSSSPIFLSVWPPPYGWSKKLHGLAENKDLRSAASD